MPSKGLLSDNGKTHLFSTFIQVKTKPALTSHYKKDECYDSLCALPYCKALTFIDRQGLV